MPITVVCTVLNEVETIERLLHALTQQTQSPNEVIIVDGGSNDGTWELLQRLESKFPKIQLIVFQKKGNRSVGRNYGIRKASNVFIAITDAGCLPEPLWLEELQRCQQGTHADVVAGYYFARPVTAFAEAVVPYVLVMPDRVNPESFLPATRSMLLSKSAWKKIGGFNEQLDDNEDYAFARKMRALNISLAFTDRAKVEWFPRTTLQQFAWMIFRFARGDAYAGCWRPKVGLIFARYIGWIALIFLTIVFENQLPLGLVLISFVLYLVWSIQKNLRYVPRGWFWLPVLQIVSDGGVIVGTLVGFGKRLIDRI